MKCASHLERDAVGICNRCGKSICADCQVAAHGENYCKECMAQSTGAAKKEERSPSLAAMLSFMIAGLGQMYNGQFGKGILILVTSWLIIPWVIGIFDAYKTAKKINEGKVAVKPRPGCFVAAVIGIAVLFFSVIFIALLAAIAIPNLLKARLHANEQATQVTLKNISQAIEKFHAENKGVYPLDEATLISAPQPYLSEPYNNRSVQGYTYSVELLRDGYRVTAVPLECQVTGGKIFSVATGGAVSSKDCK